MSSIVLSYLKLAIIREIFILQDAVQFRITALVEESGIMANTLGNNEKTEEQIV